MILAAGLTPAWQQIIVVDGLHVGEVHRAREVHWCASGKVVNVGVALQRLGASPIVLASRGGETGGSMDRDLSDLGVRCRWVMVSRPTRVCTTVLEASSGVATELVENGPPVSPEEVASFLRAYEETVTDARGVVLTGSLPTGAPRSFYRELLSRTRCRVVLDVRGPELLEALPLKPFLVKPNREELGSTLGRKLEGDAELREAIEEIRRLGAEWVAVSQGRGALWLNGPDGLRSFLPPRVRALNPIGCGDVFAAAVAWGTSEGMDVPAAVRFAMGAAAQNATTLLPSRVDAGTARHLAEEVVEVVA